MKKIEKGTFGYIRSQKIRRSLFTAVLFAVPLIIYFVGLITQKTRLTMFTFVAILLCLPACRSAVGLIMMLAQKPVSEQEYRETEAAAGGLPTLYELVFTAYEKTTPIDCMVLGAGCVAGYTSSPKADIPYIERHLSTILENNHAKRTVKIYTDFNKFKARVEEMAKSQEAKESAVRNEKARDVLLSIAL